MKTERLLIGGPANGTKVLVNCEMNVVLIAVHVAAAKFVNIEYRGEYFLYDDIVYRIGVHGTLPSDDEIFRMIKETSLTPVSRRD